MAGDITRTTDLGCWLANCDFAALTAGLTRKEIARCQTLLASIEGEKPEIIAYIYWMLQTCNDGKTKLGCTQTEIVDALLARARTFLNSCKVEEADAVGIAAR